MRRKQIVSLMLLLGLIAPASLFAKDTTPKAPPAKDAPAKDMPAKEAPAKEKDETDTSTNSAENDPFAQIAIDVGLKGKDLETYESAITVRSKKLEEWKASEKGQKMAKLRTEIAQARKDKDDAKEAKLHDEMKPYTQELSDLRETTRWDVLKLLTADQQTKFVSKALDRRLANTFDDADLTTDQKKQIEKLAVEYGIDYLREHPLHKDPYVRALIGVQSKLTKKIKEEILTPKQLEKLKAAAAAAKPSTQPSK